MKLKCDLCGSELQMKENGAGAVCPECGIEYDMNRMREKLAELQGGASAGSQQENGSVKTPSVDSGAAGGTSVRGSGANGAQNNGEKPAPAKQEFPVFVVLTGLCALVCALDIGGDGVFIFAAIGAVVFGVLGFRKSMKQIKDKKSNR